MGIEARHLLDHVIRPTLNYLDMGGVNAERLLLGTAAQESHMGQYLVQIKGPARGIWQMEPATEQDIWENYISYKPSLQKKLLSLMSEEFVGSSRLVTNMSYACAMARLQYRRYPEPLPDTIEGMAALWKKRYNTIYGAGTEEEFIKNYKRFVDGVL